MLSKSERLRVDFFLGDEASKACMGQTEDSGKWRAACFEFDARLGRPILRHASTMGAHNAQRFPDVLWLRARDSLIGSVSVDDSLYIDVKLFFSSRCPTSTLRMNRIRRVSLHCRCTAAHRAHSFVRGTACSTGSKRSGPKPRTGAYCTVTSVPLPLHPAASSNASVK